RVGGLEPEPADEHGVGHEPQHLLDVAGAAGHHVAVHLGDDAGRHGRQPGQLGVGGGLAADADQRDPGGRAGGPQVVERPLPGTAAAEQADDHGVDALQVGGAVEAGGGGRPGRGGRGRGGGGG